VRFLEFKQSETSPVKYRLELSPEEAEAVKDLLQNIIERLNRDEEE
jgi:hypothetical protein|tara:strand:+ start:1058 stop:1195 length:138 start_codon:yes stop_codon:yes gene_type:complete